MANSTIKGLTVQISGDTTKLGKAVKEAEDKSKALSGQLKDVNKLLKEPDANAVELLAQKQAILTDQVAATKEKLDTLREAEASVTEQFEKGEISAEQMRAFQIEISYTESAMRKYESAIEKTTKQLDEARVKQGEEATSLGMLQAKISAQEQELSGLREQYKNTVIAEGENSASAKELAKQISTLSGDLNDNKKKLEDADKAADTFDKTVDDTTEDSGKAAKEVKNLGDSAKDAGGKFGAAAKSVGEFIGNLALDALKSAANWLVGVGEGALETGKEFEAAMSQIAATQGFSVDDLQSSSDVMYTMDLLTEKAREMGAATAYSAAEAADGLNVLLMSGYDAGTSVGVIDTVLNEAAAGGMSIAEAAQYVSGSMKGFKTQTEGFADAAEAAAYYADLMAKGATQAATSVPELGQALSGSAATADAYKQSADSVTVALLRLAEQGEVGSGAATALSATMKNLYSPTDKAKEALDKLGVSAYDEKGNIRDFNEVVDDLAGALNNIGSDDERNDLKKAIFGQQGLEGFNKMIVTSGDKLQSFYDSLAEASGSAALQSETMMDNLEGDIKKLESAWSDLEISIYNGANEPIREVVQTLSDDLVPAINALLQGTDGAEQQVGEAVGKLATTLLKEITSLLPKLIKVVGTVASTLVQNLPTILSGLSDMAAAIVRDIAAALPDAFPLIAEALESLLSLLEDLVTEITPRLIPLIGQALAALLPVLVSLMTRTFPELLNTIIAFVRNGIQSLARMLPEILQTIGDVGAWLAAVLTEQLTRDVPRLIRVIVSVIQNGVPELLSAAVTLLSSILESLPITIQSLTEKLPSIITVILDVLLKSVPQVLDAAITVLNALVRAIPLVIQNLIPVLPQIIDAIVSTLLDNIPVLLDAALKLLYAVLDAVPVLIMELVPLIPEIVSAIMEALYAQYPQLLKTALNVFKALWEALKEIKDKVAVILVELIVNVVSAFTEMHKKVFNKVSDMASRIVEKLKELPDKLREAGHDMVAGLLEGILDKADWLISKVTDFANNVLNTILGVFDIHSPSRKLKWVGQMADEGLAGGIEENADQPLTAMRRMASGLLDETAVIPERLESVQSAAIFPETLPIGSELTDRLDRILQAIENGQILLLDGNALIGGTIGKINTQLGQEQLLTARREF